MNNSTWYDAASHAAGAALAATLPGVMAADIRATGVRIRSMVPPKTPAGADVQALDVVIEAADPAAVQTFWDIALGGPSDRGPRFAVRRLHEPRPLRNRIHVDIVRPEDAVLRARAAIGQEPTGAYGVMLADPEGNEVDLVPGDPLPGTTDWQALFSAMTHYPNAPAEFVTAVARLADAAGISLQIDVRREGVTVGSGKDRWEDGTGAPDPAFVTLAQRIEEAARKCDLTPDPERLRFVQFGIDAMDVPAVRAFWTRLLGYENDPRPQANDIYDPRRLNPVLFFQQLDEPRPQRNRIRFDLAVPPENVAERVEAAVSAGGRILSEKPYLVGDPEGNEVLIGT
jgi:hypothetical protein